MKSFFGIWLSVLFGCGAAVGDCQLPLDIVFLQDTTGDLTDVVPNMIKAVPLLLANLSQTFPNTRMALAEFQDKPYYPLGHPDGVCYNLMTELSTDLTGMIISYGSMQTLSGNDLPEAQYQAIITTVLDASVGWRRSYQPESEFENSSGGRFVIMTTDSLPHLNGDMAAYVDYDTVPKGLPENSGIISTDDTDFECLHQEYPSPQQLKDALQASGTSLIILTPNVPSLTPAWRWVNDVFLGQPSQYYQLIQPDSSDVYDAVLKALSGISYPAPCPDTTTTTTTTATSTPNCEGCPCVPSSPCNFCAPECDAAIVMRFAKEPKNMQVIVNNA